MLEVNVTPSEVLKSFSGKRVFITGHTGFKGSWLSLLLSNAGAILKGYALAPDHENSLYENLEPHLKMESVIADIRDAEKLKEAITSFRPDYLFHLAAQPLVRYSYLHPLDTFAINVMGTAHVLEALRSLQHKCTTVVITTDKVYENNETGVPFKESDPLGGHDPYSSSKAAAEIVVQSYARSFFSEHGMVNGQRSAVLRSSAEGQRSTDLKSEAEGQRSTVGGLGSETDGSVNDKSTDHRLPMTGDLFKGIATARAGNVIGGGDRSADRIIPDLVRALEKGAILQVRNPGAVRPWQHVLDPLTGYLKLAMLLNSDPHKYSGSYNFGPYPEDQLSVKEIVELAIKSWGTGNYHTPETGEQAHEAGHLRLDITKAQSLLRWEPKWNAQEAVERTVEWYKRVFEGKSNEIESCMMDIKSFIN